LKPEDSKSQDANKNEDSKDVKPEDSKTKAAGSENKPAVDTKSSEA